MSGEGGRKEGRARHVSSDLSVIKWSRAREGPRCYRSLVRVGCVNIMVRILFTFFFFFRHSFSAFLPRPPPDGTLLLLDNKGGTLNMVATTAASTVALYRQDLRHSRGEHNHKISLKTPLRTPYNNTHASVHTTNLDAVGRSDVFPVLAAQITQRHRAQPFYVHVLRPTHRREPPHHLISRHAVLDLKRHAEDLISVRGDKKRGEVRAFLLEDIQALSSTNSPLSTASLACPSPPSRARLPTCLHRYKGSSWVSPGGSVAGLFPSPARSTVHFVSFVSFFSFQPVSLVLCCS